ncbi:MAG TPA: RNA-binding cell elongation regulator Jag/EloR [Clostridia bacterium]|jgi:spoIIIJ-associated protein|nr:protein jag [Clostridiaceae bacterium]HOA30503.1 RNA-binding cell elongation regulator Jag/EloR [Clostridia bacterium]HPZ52582.1 RNA-binding cell elongation regulator Jag/EloR [Clostridia bacterium]
MAKSVEKSGRTVDEAINAALAELNIDLEDAEVDILDEGSKAVLGLFGGKEARVRVTENKPDSKVLREFLGIVVDTMDVEVRLNIENNEDALRADIYGEDVAFLIGRHGDTLQALNYLSNLIINKEKENYRRVIVDVEDYRKKKEENLRSLANRTAAKVVRYRRPVSLDPMQAYERRIIHTELQNHEYVETVSQGEEPNRCVTVRLKPNANLRNNKYRGSYRKRY